MDFSNYLSMKAANLSSSIPPKKIGKRKKNSFRQKVKPSERGKLQELKVPKNTHSKDPRRSLRGPFTAVLDEDFVRALDERIQKSTTSTANNGMSFVHDEPLHS